MADYFNELLSSSDLVDMMPCVLVPTWTNGRVGEVGIHKRLDKFLIKSGLIAQWERHRTWVGEKKFSNHWPVYFHIGVGLTKPHYPFKFNCSWLSNVYFCRTIVDFWTSYVNEEGLNPIDNLVQKLRRLKGICSQWIHQKKLDDGLELYTLESQLGDLHRQNFDSGLMDEDFDLIRLYEHKKEELLLQETKEWRLKSRAIWVSHGDGNSKLFHSYASHRRNTNAIWELKDGTGNLINGHDALQAAVMEHFGRLYNNTEPTDLLQQLRIVRLYPSFVSQRDAEQIGKAVNLEEIELALKSFARDKSLGPDGWTVEFFLHFFDLMGPDILDMVEFSRSEGYISGGLNATFLTLIPKKGKPEDFGDFCPIALCNLVYKIINKIISIRLKLLLSCYISAEQFSFLKDRQILDSIGIT